MRFGKALPIVPVALRVTVPWDIQTHTLTSNFAANLFWFSFVPWIRLDATVLKPMSMSEVRDASTVLQVDTLVCNHCCVTIIAVRNRMLSCTVSCSYSRFHHSYALAALTVQAVAGYRDRAMALLSKLYRSQLLQNWVWELLT